MNYYNPYFYGIPTTIADSAPKVGLLSRIFGKSGVTFSSILNGTQKVLNVANQAIPLVKQARPMITNAKTMFKIMNEFKKGDNNKKFNPVQKENNQNNNQVNNSNYQDEITRPVFFA